MNLYSLLFEYSLQLRNSLVGLRRHYVPEYLWFSPGSKGYIIQSTQLVD